MAFIALPSHPRFGAVQQPQQAGPRFSAQIGTQDQTPLLLALLSFIGQQRDSSARLDLDREALNIRRDLAETERDIANQSAIGEAESRFSSQVENRSQAKLDRFRQRQSEMVLPQLNREVRQGASRLDVFNRRLNRVLDNERMPQSERDAQALSIVRDLQTATREAVNGADNDLQRFGLSSRLTTLLEKASSVASAGSQAQREIAAIADNLSSFQRVYPAGGEQDAIQAILSEQATRFNNDLRSSREQIGNRFATLRSGSLNDFNREAARAVNDFTDRTFDLPAPDLNVVGTRMGFRGVPEPTRRSQPTAVEEGGVVGGLGSLITGAGGAVTRGALGEEAGRITEQSLRRGPFGFVGDLLQGIGRTLDLNPEATALAEAFARNPVVDRVNDNRPFEVRQGSKITEIQPKGVEQSGPALPLLTVTPRLGQPQLLSRDESTALLDELFGPPQPEVFQMGFR